MFVGEQGCGKTSVVRDKLDNQDDDVAEFHSLSVYCNQFTSSRTLWRSINNCLEWKHGRTYIPKGNKKLICLVDDLNLSKVLTSVQYVTRNRKESVQFICLALICKAQFYVVNDFYNQCQKLGTCMTAFGQKVVWAGAGIYYYLKKKSEEKK